MGDHSIPSPRAAVRGVVQAAVIRLLERGELALPDGVAGIPIVELSRPPTPELGDIATSLPLKLARPARVAPMRIATAIAEELQRDAGSETSVVAEARAAAPGFLNLTLHPGYIERAIDGARAQRDAFGLTRTEAPQRINVEFVSANPTGPIHMGNARGAFVGDLVCRILEGAGHAVTREYYFNDFNSQVRLLGESVLAALGGQPIPEGGYHGEYVAALAAELPGDVLVEDERDERGPAWRVGEWASERCRVGIEESLRRLVRFDVWKSEGSLYRDGWVARAIERLREGGHLYEHEGATWFRSTAFGDDKDRVVRRSNGAYTYFGSDAGYLVEKFSRADHLVYILGADHHGTVARLRNAAAAMGYDPAEVEVILVAWVRFISDGEEISMSRRAGDYITLDELLAEIGVDAARWFFAARAYTTGIDFDIELAKRQSSENPVYYVQYAHARISSILRRAASSEVRPATSVSGRLAGDSVALGLAREVLRLPEVVEDAAATRETHGVTSYATGLATAFHAYYRDRRVLDPAAPDVSAGRLALVEAVQLALANALRLLGISAPESM